MRRVFSFPHPVNERTARVVAGGLGRRAQPKRVVPITGPLTNVIPCQALDELLRGVTTTEEQV